MATTNTITWRDTGTAPTPNVTACQACGRTYHLHDTCDGCGAPAPGRPGAPLPKPIEPQNRLEYNGRIYCSRTPEEFAYWEAELSRRCRRDRLMMECVFWAGLGLLVYVAVMAFKS